jgi:hypothetical protein
MLDPQVSDHIDGLIPVDGEPIITPPFPFMSIYSGSKNRPDVWIFFTKVNSLAHLLTQALTMSV